MKLCGYTEYKEIFETVKKLGKEPEPDTDLVIRVFLAI
jgi:hypothetical protein